MSNEQNTRRQFLQRLSVVGVASTAGCLFGDDSPTGDDAPDEQIIQGSESDTDTDLETADLESSTYESEIPELQIERATTTNGGVEFVVVNTGDAARDLAEYYVTATFWDRFGEEVGTVRLRGIGTPTTIPGGGSVTTNLTAPLAPGEIGRFELLIR